MRDHHPGRGAASRNSASSRCARRPTAPSATSSTARSSASRSSARTCRASSPTGTSRSSWPATASATSTRPARSCFPGAGTVKLIFTPADGGAPIEKEVYQGARAAASPWRCTTWTSRSAGFARACFNYGLGRDYSVYLSTKNTILKVYDGRFKNLFQEVFDAEFKADVRRQGPDLRAPPDRRHGRLQPEVERRLPVGVQELRRRRAVRHRRAGLRLARPDDLGADDAGRQDGRSRSGPRHRDPPLPHAPAGQADLHQPDRVDLRLDPRPAVPRQDGRHAGRGEVRRDASRRCAWTWSSRAR